MIKRRIFLAASDSVREALEQAELPEVYHFDEVGQIDLTSGEVIVVAYGDMARDDAVLLAQRGIRPTRLSYIDLAPGDDILLRTDRPKHYFWSEAVALEDLDLDDEEVVTYPSGVGFLDKNLSWGWRLPELGVIAGSYGCGKSTVGQWLAATFLDGPGRALNASALLCSWEDIGQEVRSNFAKFQKYSDGSPDLLARTHFVKNDPNKERLLDWYKGLVRYYAERYNTKFFLLDPWNEMDHVKDHRQTETDYVRDVMRDLRKLVDELKIILIVATHVPAKITKGNGELEPFKIAQAFGSSQFGNKADRGLCIARSKNWNKEEGHTIIRLDKAKIEGKMGKRATVGLRFDKHRFRFEYDAYVTNEVKDVWKD